MLVTLNTFINPVPLTLHPIIIFFFFFGGGGGVVGGVDLRMFLSCFSAIHFLFLFLFLLDMSSN
jgi:hypothetical protein